MTLLTTWGSGPLQAWHERVLNPGIIELIYSGHIKEFAIFATLLFSA